jgi:hypothetical protein
MRNSYAPQTGRDRLVHHAGAGPSEILDQFVGGI